jgi:tetratricopeptide (TPR) repeat protein
MEKPDQWDRLCEVFSRVLREPAERRHAVLERECGGDVALLEEIEGLIEQESKARSFLGSGVEIALDPPILLTSGHVLGGRFRIQRLLGFGGMGQVYEAQDLEVSEPVALKVLRNEIATDPSALDRFRQEVQLARRITHPNVCRVYDVERASIRAGENEVEVKFITMELLEGETLAERLRRDTPLRREEADDILTQVAEGLSAAHALGIVHRDLKPANIMLIDTAGGRRRAVVTDFGLAKMEAGEDSPLTQRYIAGTPEYMAPEQLSGGPITPATDIYAFGLLVRKLESAAAGGKPRRWGGGARSEWAGIAKRCVAENAEMRFRGAGELTKALRRSTARRRFLQIAAGSSVAVTAAAVAAWKGLPGQRAMSPEADALYQKGRLHSRRLTTEDLKRAIEYFQKAIEIDRTFASAWCGLADAYSQLNDYGGMPHREAARLATAAAREAVRLAPRSGEAHASLGLAVSLDVEAWPAAERSFVEALRLNSGYAPAYQWYAGFLARSRRTQEAIAQMKVAVAKDPVSLPSSAVLGWMYYFDRQYGRAIEQGLATIDLDPNFRYGYLLLARSYAETRSFAKAVQMCDRGIELSGNAPVFRSARACVDAIDGRESDARKAAAELEQRRSAEFVSATYVSTIYSLLHDAERAFYWLEKGYEERDASILLVQAYPQFDPIRTDQRYIDLLRKLRFSV